MRKELKGIAASKGIAVAKVFKLEEIDLSFDIPSEVSAEAEISKIDKAMETTLDQLEDIKQVALQKLGAEEAQVFDAHKLILEDPELVGQIKAKIESEGKDAASAIFEVTDFFVMMFEGMDDEVFKGRAADIKDVRKRFVANVLGRKIPELSTISEEVVIVAEDLTPSETSQLNKNVTLGFVTNIGGRTSHSAIMARSLEIPAVVGTGDVVAQANDGDIILIDGLDGNVIVNPNAEEIAMYQEKAAKFEEEKKLWQQYKDKATVSKDGHHTEIVANIGTPNDLEGVINNGAEGIGLYRTEFLYMDSSELPSEEVQFEAYKKVVETMEGKPVVVRTLDIGGDKELSYLKFPEEMNPFLGYRAIRMCLDRDDIFRVQLRALLRASVYGNLKIMFPMVATLNEFRDAKAILLEEKERLISEGVQVSESIEVGIMVEIPSTAMMADTFAKEVDFFSIGTNDLIQYTMACDRMSEKISYLYQPYNPAILRMVRNVVKAAEAEGKWAGMCGEMASDPIAIPLLLAIGLHEFSMSATAVLPSRLQIASLNKAEIETMLDEILDLSTADEVEQFVKERLM